MVLAECIQFKFYVNDTTNIEKMFKIIHENRLEEAKTLEDKLS